MAKVVYLASIALVLLTLVGMIHSSFAFVVPVEVSEVKNDHGFFTTEDPIVMTVTVTNNSTEKAQFFVRGEQIDMGYEKNFRPGVESARFDLEPSKPYSFSRLMDNRWEGPFQARFTLEGRSLEGNLTYTGFGYLPYTVHSPSDVFEKENVETNRLIAYSTIAGAASSALIAIYAIRRESAKAKETKKEERYLEHSKTVGQAMVNCWVENRQAASWSYDNGIFKTSSFLEPTGRYVSQTWSHFRVGYPKILKMYEDARHDSEEILNQMERTTKSFEGAILQHLESEWPGLELKEKWVMPPEIGKDVFTYGIKGKILEALFKEATGRLSRENILEFRNDTHTVGSRIDEGGQARPVDYYPVVIPGWSFIVAYSSNQEDAKKLATILNVIMKEKNVQEIARLLNDLNSKLKAINDIQLVKFDEEVQTIKDAVMDDERLGGPGSCDLCKDDV